MYSIKKYTMLFAELLYMSANNYILFLIVSILINIHTQYTVNGIYLVGTTC